MTVHTKPPHTSAEDALFSAFGRRAGELSGDSDMIGARDRAIERIKLAGLPTRRLEAWHYTDLRSLLRSLPDPETHPSQDDIAPLSPGSICLTAGLLEDNGRSSQIEGVEATPFSTMLREGSSNGLPGDWQSPRGHEDAIGALNIAFVDDGIGLSIKDGTVLEAPVELRNVVRGAISANRFPVRIGAKAGATIIERQTGKGESFATSITDLECGEGSRTVWIILQEQDAASTYLGQINVELKKDAELTLYVVNMGGKLVRQEIHATVTGEGADLQMRGVNLLGGQSHTDVTLTLEHSVPHTTSTQIVRNVVSDSARGVFQGQIRVAAEAQKTDARMACNTLLLSDDGEFSTKPELEIFADDVQCGHGATVRDIDEAHLFYMMARGVPERTARGLLVKAFIAEIIEELEDPALVDALEQKLEDWLSREE